MKNRDDERRENPGSKTDDRARPAMSSRKKTIGYKKGQDLVRKGAKIRKIKLELFENGYWLFKNGHIGLIDGWNTQETLLAYFLHEFTHDLQMTEKVNGSSSFKQNLYPVFYIEGMFRYRYGYNK